MRCRTCQPLPEEVARAAELLGRRWVLAILWASSEAGAVRFNEFKQSVGEIPPRTLALRLVELEVGRGGRVDGREHQPRAGRRHGARHRSAPRTLHTRPPRVEYRLTDTGRRLGALVDAMRAYAAHT